MATTLVSTGIQFPDGTTQTSAATGGLTSTAATTTAFVNFPTGHYAKQDSQTTVNLTNVPGFPRLDTNNSYFSSNYQGHGPAVNITTEIGGSRNQTQQNGQNPPYPGANYTSGIKVRGVGRLTFENGGRSLSDIAIRASYHYLS